MTDLRQAAQQALEALQTYGAHSANCEHLMLLTSLPPQRKPCSCGLVAAITALRTALEQPEQQAEPPPEWLLIKNILDEYGLQAIDFVAEFKAAQQVATIWKQPKQQVLKNGKTCRKNQND